MLSQRLFTAVHGCSGSSCPQPPNRIWDTQKSNRGNGHLSIRIYFVAAGGGNVFQSAKADRKIATRPALARSPAQRFVVACRTRRGFSSCPQPPNKKGPGGAGAFLCLVEAGGMFSNRLRPIEKSLRDLRWCAVLRNAFALLVEPVGVLILPTTAKQKRPRWSRGLSLFGGGGGNRTPVREHSAIGTTCLVSSLALASRHPTNRVLVSDPSSI